MTSITPKLVSARYVGGYTLHVEFEDGIGGEVDLRDELWGEVFEPLRELELFRGFRIDEELGTVTWPGGADLAPEFLYERAAENASPGSG